jgi:hypothetical protein
MAVEAAEIMLTFLRLEEMVGLREQHQAMLLVLQPLQVWQAVMAVVDQWVETLTQPLVLQTHQLLTLLVKQQLQQSFHLIQHTAQVVVVLLAITTALAQQAEAVAVEVETLVILVKQVLLQLVLEQVAVVVVVLLAQHHKATEQQE